jgi:hypothetical protein
MRDFFFLSKKKEETIVPEPESPPEKTSPAQLKEINIPW